MSIRRKLDKRIFLSAVAVTLLFSPATALALHGGGDVEMRDANGELVTVSGKPYSPKQTCGSAVSSCHIGFGGHNYESDIDIANKDQVRRDGTISSYGVPYPQHGVTAGYHFQQGRNLDHGPDQKTYYHLPGFTSSTGMYGKF